jgi:hypothetical protein
MKTTAWIYCVGLIVLAVVFSYRSADAQYDGARETRTIAAFDAIQVGGDFEVEIHVGPQFHVEVVGEEGELHQIITQVRDSTLEIRRSRGSGKLFGLFPGNRGFVLVTMPELAAVSAAGGADVVAVDTISGESLRVTASGGADITLDIAVGSLAVASSGGADVNLTGNADLAEFRTSGGSDLNARSLTAREAQVLTSGGSDVGITVTGRLFGNVSGGSDVDYFGNPETVDVNVSGGGDLSGQ